MKMSENIVSYTSKELAAQRAQGKSCTDWQRVKNATDAEIDLAMATDPNAEEINDQDWESAILTVPLELDTEMMSWLQAQEENYQIHIQRLVREEMRQKSDTHSN